MKKRLTALFLTLAMAVTLTLPAMAAESDTGFSDVAPNAPYAEAVMWCRENGLMNGTSDTVFSPDGTLTRSMLATSLYRAAGQPAAANAPGFTDTQIGTWYSDAVAWASESGLITGYGNGLFGTNDPVSLEQLDVILHRYNGETTAWTGDPARAVPATRGEVAIALMAALREAEHYIFDLSDNVTRTAVTYQNRYGIQLSGDLYTAKDLDLSGSYPALVVGPPYGGVKEQGPGVYANEMAQRGFVVLAFDPSYNGESGGDPRHVASPDIFAEDFSAGVDFLGTLNYVDREKIGVIGICGSGGFALSAAQVDARIKAVATSAMYDIAGMGAMMDHDGWNGMIQGLAQQRWAEVDGGAPIVNNSYPEEPVDTVPAELTGNAAEFFEFYGTERGHHPRALGGFTSTSMMAMLNFQSLNHIDMISPRPILFITGDIAHSRSFSENAYAAAGEPKELYVVEGARHIDLYDDVSKIPFDKLEEFFKAALQ